MKTITVMKDRRSFGPESIANLIIRSAKGIHTVTEYFHSYWSHQWDNVADVNFEGKEQLLHSNTGDYEVRQSQGR